MLVDRTLINSFDESNVRPCVDKRDILFSATNNVLNLRRPTLIYLQLNTLLTHFPQPNMLIVRFNPACATWCCVGLNAKFAELFRKDLAVTK